MLLHSRILKYLSMVEQCGSIRQAAKFLHISSTSVNRKIIELENELGTKLFDRTSSGVSPTAAGKILLSHVSKTLSDAEAAISEINKLDSQEAHELKIVGVYSIKHIFIDILDEYYSKFSNSFLSYSATSKNDALNLLKSNQADLAIVFEPEPMEELKLLFEVVVPLEVIVRIDHVLASFSSVSIGDCANYSLVLPDSTRDRITQLFNKLGYSPLISSTSNSADLIISLVKKQNILGILSRVGQEEELESNELVSLPFTIDQQEEVCVRLTILTRQNQQMNDNICYVIDSLERRLQHYGRDDK